MRSRALGSAFAWLAVLRSPSTPPVNASTKGHGLKHSQPYTHGSAMSRTRFALASWTRARALLRDGSRRKKSFDVDRMRGGYLPFALTTVPPRGRPLA